MTARSGAEGLLRDTSFADEMRRMRLELDAAHPKLGTLMVIGATGGEGVSTVVSALHRLYGEEAGLAPGRVDLAEAADAGESGEELARWRSRIDELRAKHGLVLIDAPPATRAGIGLALAPHVDAVLIVVECDRTRLDALAFVREKLDASGARVAGSILNRTGRWLPTAWWRRLRRRRQASTLSRP